MQNAFKFYVSPATISTRVATTYSNNNIIRSPNSPTFHVSSCSTLCLWCLPQLVALSCWSLGYLARSIGFSFGAYLYLYRHLTDAAFSACKWHSLRHFGSTNEGDFKTLPVWHENELPAKAAEGLPLTVSKVLSQKTATVSKRYL